MTYTPVYATYANQASSFQRPLIKRLHFYRITPKKGADQGVRAKVSLAASKLASPLLRPTNFGVVMLADERVDIMRWGFHRSFNPAITNARSDKLDAGMWAAAYRERRCIDRASAGSSRRTISATRMTITCGSPDCGNRVLRLARATRW